MGLLACLRLGWPWTCNFPASASQVAGKTDRKLHGCNLSVKFQMAYPVPTVSLFGLSVALSISTCHWVGRQGVWVPPCFRSDIIKRIMQHFTHRTYQSTLLVSNSANVLKWCRFNLRLLKLLKSLWSYIPWKRKEQEWLGDWFPCTF